MGVQHQPLRYYTVTLTNPIIGGGGFAQLCTGTKIFLRGKTYTGTTTIAAGTLQIGNGGNIGTIGTGDIIDNGILAINKGNSFALNNNISGTGGLNQIGAGTTTLNGFTTYSGPTNITAGILRAGAAGVFSAASAFTVGPSGTLNLSSFNHTIGSLAGSGPVLLSSGTLTTGNDGTTTTYSGRHSRAPAALTKIGGGNFILSGTSSYLGSTTINAGILSVNGSIVSSSGVTVNAGGTLGGTGQLPSVAINGGTLAPGNSIGTVTINGSLVFTAASTYLVEVSPTAADRTNVTGAATLAGTVSLSVAGAPNFAKVYTILSAAGGRNGTFGALAYTNPLVTAVLSYTTTDVLLSFNPNLKPFVGTTTNQSSTGTAIQNALGGRDPGAFEPRAVHAGARPPVPGAITQLTGELGTGFGNASMLDMDQFLQLMLDPFADGRNAGPDAPAPGFAPERRPSTDAFNQLLAHDRMATKAPKLDAYAPRWTLWGGAYGASGTLRGDPTRVGSHDINARNAGFAAGADYLLLPDTIAGFALTGSSINYGLSSGLGSGNGDAIKGGAYISQRFADAFISASFAVGRTDARTDRFAVVGGVFDHLTASPNGTSIGGRVEAGYRVGSWLNTAIVPYAALQAQNFRTNAYSETDASGLNAFALNYGAANQSQVRSELGSRFDFGAMAFGTATLSWRARAAWAHDYSSAPSIGAAFQALPGANFTVIGAQRARDAALLSIGPQLQFGSNWTLRAKFDGEFANGTQIYAGTGTLRYSW